jgi:hypothetical protein
MLRLPHLAAALLLSSCTCLPPARAADDINAPTGPIAAEAIKLGEIFRAEVAKVALQYAETARNLPAVQQAQLVTLQKKLKEAGDLDGYLAVTREIKRFAEALKAEPDPFEKIPELPEAALVDKPEALRAIQDQYLKVHKDKGDSRNKRVEDLARGYVAQLDALKADLTIKGRIQDAISVKREAERIRKGLEDKTFMAQALNAAPKAPVSIAAGTGSVETAPATPDIPVYGKAPEWSKWQFDRTGDFAGDANLFAHPDLPDQLTIDFTPKNGRGRISGRCEVERQTVDMRECAWFGKAIQWRVKDLSTLNATFILQSREIAAGQGYGPKAYLLLMNEKGQLGESLEVTMMWKDTTLTIAKDPDSSRCTLGWVQGKIKKTVELPASGSMRVLVGIAVRNLGERCDTTLSMQ